MTSLLLWVWVVQRVWGVEWVLKGRELERVWGVVQAQKVEWVEVVGWVGQAEGVGRVEWAGEVEWVGKVAAEQAEQAVTAEGAELAELAEAAEAEQAATRSLEGYTERTASATSSSRDDCRVGAEPARQAS